MRHAMSIYRSCCIILTCTGLAACSSSPDAPEPAPRAVVTRSLDRRLDAIAGLPLLIPVDDSLGPVGPNSKAALDDGTPVPLELHRVLVHVAPPGPGETAPDQWLPNPGVWSSIAVTGRADVATGAPVLVLRTPPSAEGQGIVIDGRRFAVNWIPEPILLARAEPGAEVDPWKPVAPTADIERAFLLSAAVPEARNPLTRWRYRLLVGGLRPDAPDAAAFEDPVIETLARQNDDRWRVGLMWLWAADQDTSWRLKQRLCAFVRFPGGRAVPAWTTDHASLDRLLSDLLNPALSPRERVSRAEAWLADQPQMAAWIADDGGVLDAARQVVAIAGIANISAKTTMGWGSRTDSPGDPDLQPLKPWSVIEVAMPLGAVTNETGDISLPTSIGVHAGKQVVQLPVFPGRLPIAPPGLRIESFEPDWMLASWLSNEHARARPEWSTQALLYLAAPDAALAEGIEQAERWELFVQCNRAPAVGDPSNEAVRIYVGPPDKPKCILRVNLRGELVDELSKGELAATESIAIATSPDRWSFKIKLPPGAAEADGTLRLGIARTDAALRRTSWPRAVFPWQDAPPRAAVDTGRWNASTN